MEDTMLIVDDVEMNRIILKVLFEKKYAILEAENGREALEIVERCQGNIDMILLDLIMEDMTGFEVLEHRSQTEYFRDIPVVVITVSGAMEDQIKAFKMGANDYINKPFIPEIVISRVDNVMASHRRMISIELEAQKLKIKSELDQMTGLYNKTTTELAINEILKQGDSKLHVLLIIDIDNFKSVNDISGHQAGDHVIRIVSDLISSLFRKTDIVGRIGGDEFAVMMVDVPSMNIVYDKVNELIQIMKYKPNLTIPENVTLSIGIVSNERKASNYGDLFKKADESLYQAKEDGKARYREYGVEPVNIDNDKRMAVMLVSRNRSVCSIVHALIPPDIRVIEVLNVSDLSRIKKKEKEKSSIIYADVSDLDDPGDSFWEELKEDADIDFNKVFAICKEGNMLQLMAALKRGVAEVLMFPIDGAAFKRRTMKKLESLNKRDAADDSQ